MSQATDLLNSLTDEQISAYSSNSGEKPHIVIGEDRFITVPESLKRIAVQYDHNVETKTFDCPRYSDDLDMSEMIVYINYMLPNKQKASYIAENIEADGDIMHFTWTISSNITQTKGQIAFLVCIKKTGTNADGEAIEINHWNSELCTDCYISEGMECETSIEMEYPDIVTQLLERMTEVEKAESTMAGYLTDAQSARTSAQTSASEAAANATIALETKDEVLEAENHIKNAYANALKGNVSGEIIRVDDVSPVEHDVKCRAHGKNLVNIDFIDGESSSDRSVIQKDGDAVVFPAFDGNLYGLYMNNSDLRLQVGRTYTASVGDVTAFDSSSYGWRIRYTDGTTAVLSRSNTATFTVEKKVEKIIFRIGSPFNGNTESRVTNIQIEEGSVATEYEPYIDPTTITVSECGKNLFDINTIRTQGSVTNNNDGSVTVTASTSQPAEKFGEICHALKAGNVATLSFISENKEQNFIYLVGSKVRWDNGTTKTITQSMLDGVMYFYAKKDGDGNGVATRIYDIQIELGETVTEYEPYVEPTSAIPDTDGTGILSSVSPTMTVYTDTPGVTIEAEYNRDINKVLESIMTALNL